MPSPGSTARPVATVVIVDWNEPEVTLEAVRSVLEQRIDGDLEVLVVDNGSPRTAAGHPAADLPGVRVIRTARNLGFAGGANAGIAEAAGEAVVLLNNDARMRGGALRALLAPLRDEGGRVGAVTALMLLDGTDGEATVVNSTGGEVTRSANGRDRDWRVPLSELRRPAGPVTAFSGGAVALRAEALADVGGALDESYFMYYEDTDLSWRLRRRGWGIVYAPDAVVVHRHAFSSGTRSTLFRRRNARNRIVFAAVHAPARTAVAAVARTALSSAADLVRGRAGDAWQKLRGLGSAIIALPGALRRRRAVERSALVSREALWSQTVPD